MAKEAAGGSQSSITLGQEGDGVTDYFLPGLANKPDTPTGGAGGSRYLTVDSQGRISAGTADLAPGYNIVAPSFNCSGQGQSSTCFGDQANASGDFTSAFGYQANATAERALAVGSGARANFSESTALGQNAQTTRAGQIALGSSQSEVTITNLSGAGQELVFANQDGTLQRSAGIGINDGSLTIAKQLILNGRNTMPDDKI